MRIITLEDHYLTALHDEYHPKNAALTVFLEERSRHLGHDVEMELNDIGERRVAAMDAAGIDFQVLSLTVPGCQAFGPEEAEKAIRLAEDSAPAVTRFFTAAITSSGSPSIATRCCRGNCGSG